MNRHGHIVSHRIAKVKNVVYGVTAVSLYQSESHLDIMWVFHNYKNKFINLLRQTAIFTTQRKFHMHTDDQGNVEFFQDLKNKVFTKYLTSYQPIILNVDRKSRHH